MLLPQICVALLLPHILVVLLLPLMLVALLLPHVFVAMLLPLPPPAATAAWLGTKILRACLLDLRPVKKGSSRGPAGAEEEADPDVATARLQEVLQEIRQVGGCGPATTKVCVCGGGGGSYNHGHGQAAGGAAGDQAGGWLGG